MTRHDWDLLWTLTRTEFRMRDQGTWAGFLWTLLHPLFIFAILYVLFTRWIGAGVEHYAAYLLIGIVHWNFFSTATGAGLSSLRRKAPLIHHYRFPRIWIVLSCVNAVFLSHLLEWGLLLGALVWMGVAPSTAWLALPLVIAVQWVLILALSSLLSVMAVHVQDLSHVWGILLYGLFFLTPVFYTAEILDGLGRSLVGLNPVASILEAARGILIDGNPAALWSLTPAAAAAASLGAIALWAFPRGTRGVAEKL